MADADARGPRGARREKDFRGGGVRVFLKEMVLDLPDVIDAEPVGQLDLGEGFMKEPVLRRGVQGRGSWCSYKRPNLM